MPLTRHMQQVLDFVTANPGLHSTVISERIKRSANSTSGSLSELYAKGLVERESDPEMPIRFIYRAAAVPPVERPKMRQRKYHVAPHKPAASVLFVLEVGKNGSVPMTFEEARKIYDQLHTLFGSSK